MSNLASDVDNRQFQGATDPDSVMIARFYMRAIRNNFMSEKEGRPIFEDRLYCEYYPAGSTLLKMDVPAYDNHKQRFSKQWAYYQTTHNEDATGAGTPLSQWAILSPADVENLRGMKFQTIENLAAMSDFQGQSLGMGIAGMAPHVLRARAQAYIGSAQDSALPQAQAAEIQKLRDEQAEKDRKHAAEMAELRSMIEAKQSTPPIKAKRVMTPEHKAAMAAGREKAKQQKAE